MMLTVSMVVGLGVGVALYLMTRKRAGATAWTALVLGVIGSVAFVGTINGFFLPSLGRFGAVGIGMLSGIATALATASLVSGERKPLNWVALVFSAPPVLFLIFFGAAELLGPPH